MEKITENLILQGIEANNWRHDSRDREITTCWLLHFSFFGHDGFEAFFTNEAIKKEYADYSMIESGTAELHDSFADALEKNWKEIVRLISNWEKDNFNEQTRMVRRIEQNRADAGLV